MSLKPRHNGSYSRFLTLTSLPRCPSQRLHLHSVRCPTPYCHLRVCQRQSLQLHAPMQLQFSMQSKRPRPRRPTPSPMLHPLKAFPTCLMTISVRRRLLCLHQCMTQGMNRQRKRSLRRTRRWTMQRHATPLLGRRWHLRRQRWQNWRANWSKPRVHLRRKKPP